MTQKDDKRVSRAINNAESRKKCLLLVNNIVDESLRGTPLLTQSQASEIAQTIKATAGFDATGKYAIGTLLVANGVFPRCIKPGSGFYGLRNLACLALG